MDIKYAFARFVTNMQPKAVKNGKIDKKAKIGHGTQFVDSSIGRYSYIGANCGVVKTEIGSFCSIAAGTSIGGGAHPLTFVSSSPVFCKGKNILKTNFAVHDFDPYKKTVIGHDVWIGAKCLIKGGVTIGTGAVIGMGSVVTKDVPPYAIVGGNPAKIIRYRFDEETVKGLLESKWWELPEEELKEKATLFTDPKDFLKHLDKKEK